MLLQALQRGLMLAMPVLGGGVRSEPQPQHIVTGLGALFIAVVFGAMLLGAIALLLSWHRRNGGD